MKRILLVDDHAVVRKGLKHILEGSSQRIKVEEAETGEQALKKVRNQPWDAVILDIALADRNGIDVLKRIKTETPTLPVLILSMYPEEQYGMRMLKAGADGYLTKAVAPEKLVEAVERLLSGKRYVSPELTEKLVEELTGNGGNGGNGLHNALSDREYQISLMIGSGMMVSEIARKLSLSVKTVHTHRARILRKMRIKNNAELIHYVIKHKLID